MNWQLQFQAWSFPKPLISPKNFHNSTHCSLGFTPCWPCTTFPLSAHNCPKTQWQEFQPHPYIDYCKYFTIECVRHFTRCLQWFSSGQLALQPHNLWPRIQNLIPLCILCPMSPVLSSLLRQVYIMFSSSKCRSLSPFSGNMTCVHDDISRQNRK